MLVFTLKLLLAWVAVGLIVVVALMVAKKRVLPTTALAWVATLAGWPLALLEAFPPAAPTTATGPQPPEPPKAA